MIPEDDEPLTDEEIRDIEKAREDFKQGETVSWEDVKRELDL